MKFSELTLKERTAIELRYVGNTAQDISDKVSVAKSTVDGWFDRGGRLVELYKEYTAGMNVKRQSEAEGKYIESDENILKITTYILRQVGTDLSDGKIKLDIGSFREAWKIQRTLQGLATDVKSSNIKFENEEELEKARQELKKALDEPIKTIQNEEQGGIDTETGTA